MATRHVRGPLPEYGYLATVTGMRRGTVLVMVTNNTKAKLATSIGEGAYRGIQIDEGALPDGSANYGQDSSHPAEMVNAQKEGIAWGLVPANTTVTMGDQAWANASAQIIKRTPFSFSGFILGQFDESATTGSAAELHSVEMFPQYIEVVRPVYAVATDATVGAATKYMAGVGVALSGSEVPVALVQYTGQKARNLWVSTGTAAGNGETLAVTVIKSSDNGGTWSATTLTVTLTGTAGGLKFASELSLASAALAAGDLVGIKLVSSAGNVGLVRAGFDLT